MSPVYNVWSKSILIQTHFKFKNNCFVVLKPALNCSCVFPTQKWPGGLIPYTISGVFNTFERGMIYRSIKEFSDKSCITWIPRDPTKHSDFVHMTKDRGCYSKVGRMRGAQVLSLGKLI